MRRETYIVRRVDDSFCVIFCKKDEILDNITGERTTILKP